MNYSSLEDAYGTPFGQRVPVTHTRKDVTEAPPAFTSLSKKSEESIRKNQSLVDEIQKTLPLDSNPTTENFVPVQQRVQVRERFSQSQPAGVYESMEQSDKLTRILRLIEQNRTGYERPAVQDIALYVFTGVFFLYTFDTFVTLGKTMR
jgi:hypothetical protein